MSDCKLLQGQGRHLSVSASPAPSAVPGPERVSGKFSVKGHFLEPPFQLNISVVKSFHVSSLPLGRKTGKKRKPPTEKQNEGGECDFRRHLRWPLSFRTSGITSFPDSMSMAWKHSWSGPRVCLWATEQHKASPASSFDAAFYRLKFMVMDSSKAAILIKSSKSEFNISYN